MILKLTLLIDTGTRNSVDSLDDSVAGDIECSDLTDATIERSFDGLQDNESSECFKFPLEKVILLLLWPRASIPNQLQYVNDQNIFSNVKFATQLSTSLASMA